MSAPENNAKPEQELTFMEKVGMRYLRRLDLKGGEVVEEDAIHILNPRELAELRRIERNVVLRAALAGAMAGLLCAIASLLAWPLLGPDPDHPGWPEFLLFWGVVSVVSILVTLMELAWLYYDSLRTVFRLAAVAGLDLFPEAGDSSAVLRALVRAALEVPNPAEEEHGVNPRREISKFRILIFTLVYKLKVTATSVIFKLLIGRIGGRFIARKYLDFFGMPVYAAWDAAIMFRVIREARIRAMGPSAVEVLLKAIIPDPAAVRPVCKLALERAAGAAVVCSADMHPNHNFLLRELIRLLGDPGKTTIDSTSLFMKSLEPLTPEEQDMVLKLLAVACIIDGRIARRERKLWMEAREMCGLSPDDAVLYRLKYTFRSGGDTVKELISFR